MNALSDILTETSVGEFHMLTQRQQGTEYVVAAGFSKAAELQARLPEALRSLDLQSRQPNHPYINLVQRYLQGDLLALAAIPFIQTGSPFSKAIWNTLQAIPPGETVSYAELARKSGHGTAVRAAGTACSNNRIILLVPCHRVVKSNRQPGNYLYGPTIKNWLLAHETKYSAK